MSLLQHLLDGAGIFTQTAMAEVDPQLAAFAKTLPPFVSISLIDGSAKLVVVPSEGSKIVFQGQVPKELGQACGRYATSVFAQMDDEQRTVVGGLLKEGGVGLGVVVVPLEPPYAQLVLDAGNAEPLTLDTLDEPTPPETLH